MSDEIWTVREARASFASLLAAARDGVTQTIRAAGEKDVLVVESDRAAREILPMSYLLDALAHRDAYELALHQHEAKQLNRQGWSLPLLPGPSADVVRWLAHERGALHVARYVVFATAALRHEQARWELEQATFDQVVSSFDLVLGEPRVIDNQVRQLIVTYVRTMWAAEADEMLGPELAVLRGLDDRPSTEMADG
jgi:antitoxin (DNA-binding transcriptional repressor) of toxin-antitoxin stability system